MTPGIDGSTSAGFEAFYVANWREAARWAAALTGSVAAGEDVAQVAFGRVASRFDSLDRPVAYLRRVVVNTARSEGRSGQRRSARELRVEAARRDTFAEPAFDGGSGLLQELARLSYDQRAAVVLRYWADWDEATIADALGCRPATVRSHIKRALDTLRRELSEETQ